MTTYQRGVYEDDAAQEYLAARGLDEETALTARLGVVTDPHPGHDRYRGMVCIPYLSKAGYPLTVRFRCIDPECEHEYHGKYNSLPGEPPRLYNVGAIFSAGDELHVTEGEFDALILNQIGLPAVSVPGALLFRRHHRRMLAGFSKVWVWGDPDDAGADLVNKVTRQLRQAKGVRLRHGDVTDTYLDGGRDALLSLIEEED